MSNTTDTGLLASTNCTLGWLIDKYSSRTFSWNEISLRSLSSNSVLDLDLLIEILGSISKTIVISGVISGLYLAIISFGIPSIDW